MSGASDKARFYLEQTVPELREWERRELFSASEISSITRKRSDFEHILNARGSKPADYLRYIEYESNLDTLRRKRIKRKKLKASKHTSQRRIFGILDRATRKFNGDLGLWMQYIEFAQREKSHKRLSRVLTEALRMHPTKPELWIYAAQYNFEVQGDMGGTRSAMQRGLRFCKNSRVLYLEFARLEMEYLLKVAGRRKVLGIDEREEKALIKEGEDGDEENGDVIALPTVTAADMEETGDEKADNQVAMADIYSTPAYTGAIPRAVFDAAMKQFSRDDELGERFFALFAEYISIPSTKEILQHSLDSMSSLYPKSASTHSCLCRMPLALLQYNDPRFPAAIRAFLKQLKISSAAVVNKQALSAKVLKWLTPIYEADDLGPELKQVLQSVNASLSKDAAG